MKFIGEPNMLVLDSKRDNKPIFRFDENGEFATEDEGLIKRLKPHFRFEDNAKSDLIECKYCGGAHENKGQLLACARKQKKEAS